MRFISFLFVFGVILNCDDGTQDPRDLVPMSSSIKTLGGETINLDDGSQLVLAEDTFRSPTDVTFSRTKCGGIFRGNSFGSCEYTVAFTTEPAKRFGVTLPGVGTITGEKGGEFKAIGVINQGTARDTRRFALRSVEDASCIDIAFSACGGDLSGEWELEYACGSLSEVTSFSFSSNKEPYAACGEDDWLREYPFSTNRTLSFGEDGVYDQKGSLKIQKREVVTQPCLSLVGESCHPDCIVESDICHCLFNKVSGIGAGGGTWAYSESEPTSIIFDGPNAEEGESDRGSESEYCVDGDQLSIRARGSDAVFVYQKR